MGQQVTMDRDRTAVIIMDFQNRIVNTAARETHRRWSRTPPWCLRGPAGRGSP